MIGYALDWRPWWVSVCSVLCLLIVEGMVTNFVLFRRDRVTVGTDDEGPALRLAVVALTTAALVAAAVVSYTQWTRPDRELANNTDEVVRLAVKFSEATLTYSAPNPTESIDRAAEMMVPESAENFKASYGKAATEQVAQNISAQAQTISAGVNPNGISPDAAVVTTVLRATRQQPGKEQERANVALQIALTKKDGQWRVITLLPLSPAPPPE
jgi:hypothetical protein